MAKAVVFKPIGVALKDNYQGSVSTNYQRDQVTGELFKTSGSNVRTIIPEQFKTAKFINEDDSATNSDNDVYIVPAGKIFVMTFAFLNVCCTNAVASLGSTGRLRYRIGGGAYKALLRFMAPVGVSFSNNQGLTPSAYMVFDELTEFNVSSSNAAVAATSTVMGYEIDKSEYLGVFN